MLKLVISCMYIKYVYKRDLLVKDYKIKWNLKLCYIKCFKVLKSGRPVIINKHELRLVNINGFTSAWGACGDAIKGLRRAGRTRFRGNRRFTRSQTSKN